MPRSEGEATRFFLPDMQMDDSKSYGCVFCLTGKEEMVAHNIELVCPDVRATPIWQVKRKTNKGNTTLERKILFPGYVFIEASPLSNFASLMPRLCVLYLLSRPETGWRLTGNDEKFARWIMSQDGVIQFSKAYEEGERIKILSGPLKDLEGYITRVDKRNQNGQVTLTFDNRTIKAWLGFDLVARLDK